MVSLKVELKKLYRKYKRKVLIKKNKMAKNTLCVIPWTHLNFEPNGKVVPCCLTSYHDYFAGDLNTQTIEEIWNSENMKALRLQFLNGEEPKICSTCFDREKVTGESGRYYQNKEFKDVIKIIPEITKPDGTCTTMELKYWDFRFSNLCNFKCRSCGPRYSSAWVPDYKKLGWGEEQDKVWNIEAVNDNTNYDFLKDQVKHVQKVYFAGGEPLLMPEHWQTLDLLVENKRFDVKLNYNTNCSTFVYGKKNALDYWRQWDNDKVEVWPSLDEIGERAELIRSGTVWTKVEENLKELIKLDNVTVRPGMTIGAWNVRRLPVIINHLIDIGVISAKHRHQNFFINLLQQPTQYHVHILPDEYRQETIAELKEFIANHNATYNTTIDHLFTHIIHELEQPFDLFAAKKFLWNTEKIDGVRNEDLFKTIPEMTIVRDYVNSL
ncbi:4Fe4S-binding SPASM domain containing protein [uncultured Caudovirales phage]|uniref:4Fe4S-binding SPASM domain containing protein n=1 Tax=uncultured Caudovirales phage TaxID=2100421 RepID=A0A6J5KYE8_9CAUD|nr:4Fe4S-binding SPASM domain containing protein [uncultured Caudovirales phage]CAB5208865.1 4Fe4S-binding SPASM domain containing protein [uncultured Caudovirales phage]